VTVQAASGGITAGDQLPPQTFTLRRESMVAYANASGDHNPIHLDEAWAKQVGLPDVIAHGMLTMGIAVRVVTDWLGDPGAVTSYGVRFTRPVVVPAGVAVEVNVAGSVRSVDAEAGSAEVDLTATVNGETVLAKSRVGIRLAAISGYASGNPGADG
jgi:acyl dehydratase